MMKSTKQTDHTQPAELVAVVCCAPQKWVAYNHSMQRFDDFSSPSFVCVFTHAKPALKALLTQNIQIARPVCLTTLEHLCTPEEPKTIEASTPETLFAELERLMGQIEERGLQKIARLECLLLPSIAMMEHKGLYLDPSAFQHFAAEAKNNMLTAQQEALKLLGVNLNRNLFGEVDLNLESTQEVKEALEGLLKRPLENLSHESLHQLKHPAADALLKYREYAKLVKTYAEPFGQLLSTDSRLHASFEPLGTNTGRMACHSPNLQNLPGEQLFQKALQAPQGRALVTADYAACELRILASLSNDANFIKAFERDADLHAEVASQVFHVPVSSTENPHLRARAKAINFGLMYGMGAKALAAQLKLSLSEAEELFERYFAAFPTIRFFLDKLVESALDKGYCETVLGRKLYLDPAVLKTPEARGTFSRIARSMPIQGSAADMIKLAMLRLHERLMREFQDAYIVNMIHDELVVECRQEDAHLVKELTQSEMEAAQRLLFSNVPPKVQLLVCPEYFSEPSAIEHRS